MSKQWLQIVAIWILVAVGAVLTLLMIEGDYRFLSFSAIAAGAIALVSLEHLISAKAKDTVRQQSYVSAGSVAILAVASLVALVS
ncbi:MAG: hypothetical protein RL198_1001 [Actinomycetota bacterium]|jgi:hypothetical protein